MNAMERILPFAGGVTKYSAEKLPAMTDDAIGKVRELEALALQKPQVRIATHHTLHGGLYTRTIFIPAGVLITGCLVKIPTTLIVHGMVTVYIGDEAIHLKGCNVLPASANRKQAFFAHADTYLTMCFPTLVKTVEDAEYEFTDESAILVSRKDGAENIMNITGE